MIKAWKELDGEDIGGFILSVAALCGIGVLLTMVTADHRVRGYYLQAGTSSTCIFQDADWTDDHSAFCSDDISKVLTVYRELKAK